MKLVEEVGVGGHCCVAVLIITLRTDCMFYLQENTRLLAQVSAQESVVEGLREERKLWGKELAHQGATLAQDRGRMEAQVDALSQEVKSLQEHLQNERDSTRIKSKQIEDQLQTIHQLKQSVSSSEHELQSRELDWQKEQQALQLQLEQSEAANQEIQVCLVMHEKGYLNGKTVVMFVCRTRLLSCLNERNSLKRICLACRNKWSNGRLNIGNFHSTVC